MVLVFVRVCAHVYVYSHVCGHMHTDTFHMLIWSQVHTPCILGKIEADRAFGCEIYKRFIEVVVERLVGSQIQMLDIYAKPGQGA